VGAYGRFIRRLGHERWFAAIARPVGSRVDRVLYRASGGRLVSLGHEAPVLLLTTAGRRTGRRRTTPVMYLRDGTRFVVSSEDFGQRRSAAWPLNLDADPRAEVRVGSMVLTCRARRLSDEEADSYWPRLVEAWPAHRTYRERSGRRHTFVLEPVSRSLRMDGAEER
jgi:deazaflavin-dependent oxidoreductase (nitroreductase family)